MSGTNNSNVYRLVERNGPAGRRVVEARSADRRDLFVVAGFSGGEWPETLTSPVFESRGTATGAGSAWRLTSGEGRFDFEARTVERVTTRPGLYGPLHRPFELTPFDRFAVRVLLALLRLPGGARLLRRWHARQNG